MMMDLREKIAAAIEGAEVSYHLHLVKLVDGVSTYNLTFDGEEPIEFNCIDDAYALIASRKRLRGADLALGAIEDAGYTVVYTSVQHS